MTQADVASIRFRLNGVSQEIDLEPDTRLSHILREDRGMTASKVGCGIGRCGACTVMVNGQVMNSCLVMAWQLQDADIVSPEGLDVFEAARILKAALTDENSFQCGYCAPGFTMALTALFLDNPLAGDADIIAALEGNICRCTGYHSIIRGALSAAERLRAVQSAVGSGDQQS